MPNHGYSTPGKTLVLFANTSCRPSRARRFPWPQPPLYLPPANHRPQNTGGCESLEFRHRPSAPSPISGIQIQSRTPMAPSSSSKLLFRRLLSGRPPLSRALCSSSSLQLSSPLLYYPSDFASIRRADLFLFSFSSLASRAFFCSYPSPLDEEQGPASIDYRMLVSEEEFHKLADLTLYDLQEKFEVYGDSIQVDGFDIDFGNQVLTLKLANFGTYVINKQTPNRQIWLSSPVSGPSRFDWDKTNEAWVYRRTKASLLRLLEDEISSLCGKPIALS